MNEISAMNFEMSEKCDRVFIIRSTFSGAGKKKKEEKNNERNDDYEDASGEAAAAKEA